VTGAVLTDGTTLDIDFAVVGVGINPASILAESAGLDVGNGITTDIHGRTSDPHIWAAGDCASCLFHGQTIRLESVGNAIDQAEAVAVNIAGGDEPYVPKPWFWSDQYDCKLQIAGLNMGYSEVYVRKGDAPGVQSNWYYRGDALLAVDAMNDPRNYMIGKRLIEAGRSPDPALITDPATDMKALLKP
jgi:3-phenylpropionate/trans-cinnamate dioxygenase ferredoxin reductase subunit